MKILKRIRAERARNRIRGGAPYWLVGILAGILLIASVFGSSVYYSNSYSKRISALNNRLYGEKDAHAKTKDEVQEMHHSLNKDLKNVVSDIESGRYAKAIKDIQDHRAMLRKWQKRSSKK